MRASKPRRRILLVLGMHRSGTSAAARVANLLGADLGDRLIAPGPDNPDGFWEHADAVRINDDLLAALGSTWYDMREMPHGWMETDAAVAALERIKALIRRDFQSSALPAIKDPRMCLTAPLWLRGLNALGFEADCLFVVRDPREVVESLHLRNEWARRPLFLMWVQYLMAAEAATQGCRRTLITYDEMLADWRPTMRRVALGLGLDWPVAPEAAAAEVDAFLQRGRRHHQAAPLDASEGAVSGMPELAARLYKACLDIAAGGAWASITQMQEAFRSTADLYEAHVGALLKSRWDAEARAQSADQRLAEERDRVRELASIATGAQDTLAEKLGGMGHQLVELQHELRDLNAGFKGEMEKLQRTLGAREAAIQALSGELADRNSAVQALSADLAGEKSVNERLSGELAGKESTIRTLSDELMGKESAIRTLSGNLAEKESAILALSGELAEKESALKTLSGALAGKESEFRAVSNELAGKVRALSDELSGRDAAIQALTGELSDKKSAIHSLAGELADSKVHVQQLLTSTSWKITAPLRFLKAIVSPRRLKTGSGRFAKGIYDRLPLSGANKLALKGAAFRVLAPIIRNTRSYLAWQAYEGRLARLRAGEARDPHVEQPVAAANPDADRASRLLGDLYAHSNSGLQSDYVPMDGEPADASSIDVRAIAFYLPQFHPIPENDAWWGRGFTEWTNVSKAMPQFVGHYQPHLPGELGFYDLRVVDTMRRQVELARHYGLQGFCFHYYWFAGRRLLERPIEQYLANKDIDFPFCICWANENWSRRWDGQDQDILIAQKHSAEDDIDFITALEPLLRDPRYIRVDGRPLIVLYRPSILPDAAATLERWRQHCRDVGIGEIFLGMVQFDVEDPRLYGFDVAIEFPPHKLARDLEPINGQLQIVNPNYAGHVIDYSAVVERARETAVADFPMIRGVFPGWDNEARKPGRGYTFANSTPARYSEWLSLAVDYARERPVAGERLVFINAWNEWAEGAHLEPDRRYGYAYLAATRDVLVRDDPTRQKLVVVSHDAHPHGAQYLSLNIVRELRTIGVDVECVLLDDGVLRAEFEALARVCVLGAGATPEDMAGVARDLKARGVSAALANTAVSGVFARHLSDAGIEVVSLVHELPGVIRSSGLQGHVKDIAASAKAVVFAAEPVKAGFESFSGLNPGQAVIRPQGLYKRNAARHRTAEARLELRRKLGIAEDAKVVLCVGYADMRKGIDLFVEAGISLCESDPDVHMVWVGHFDLEIEDGIRQMVDRAGCSGNFHFTGRQTETDVFYSGSDLYALTSREDPYPSVVLEAFDAGLPVVGFEGCGGLDGILRSHGAGLVAMADTRALADACRILLRDEGQRLAIGNRERTLIDSDYSFRAYVMDLLSITPLAIPRVSVVVPNYNYARYLPERLHSIAAQTFPVYEIIVLDDASQDESLEVIRQLEAQLSVRLRVIPAAANSGSVFQQWQKGADLARGEFLWIAEADDLAMPGFLRGVLPRLLDEKVVMSYCQSIQIDENGRVLAGDYLDYVAEFDSERWRHAFTTDLPEELAHGFAVKNTIPNVSAVVFRRDVLAQVLAENIDQVRNFRIAGDWMVYLKVLERGQLAFIPESLNLHRRHGGSVTLGGDSLPHLREVMQVHRHVREHYPVTDLAKAGARLYADWLYEYFGLATKDAPELVYHRDLRGLLQ